MRHLLILFAALLLGACNFDPSVLNKPKALPYKITNGIVINDHGLKVQQAYLVFNDSSAIPESNETQVDKQINCRLLITGGWKEKNNKVYPGVSTIIETSDGDTLSNEPDLLADTDTAGIAPEQIDHINLTATISKLEKTYDHFLMRFKVWDKNSDAYTEGSFKFKVK